MSQYFLNKYTALAILIQFVVVALIWMATLALAPTDDFYFGLMIYFYLPAIALASALASILGSAKGEFGAFVVGLPCGIVFYGLIFGLVISYLKSRRRGL